MQALVYQGPEQLIFEKVGEPNLQPGELLLKVDSVGICGSELEGYLGHSSIRKPPLIASGLIPRSLLRGTNSM